MSIDQEKAFDRIEWIYVYSIMEKMGIPAGLIQWCKLLYSGHLSKFIVNNYIGSHITIKRGIRQGYPLSPLLFAICAEGMSTLIINNPNIEGIKLPDHDEIFKVVQHADDITIFIRNNQDVNVLKDIFNVYCGGSGSRIHYDKTAVLWLGKWKTRTDPLVATIGLQINLKY